MSYSTSTSTVYTTETYSTATAVTQDKQTGDFFTIDMTPQWYYENSEGGTLFFRKEVVITWRVRNISTRRMSNVTVAMRFLHNGKWTNPIVMQAGDLEPSESTLFTKRAGVDVQLDQTSEPYFYQATAFAQTPITTTRTFTSLYTRTFTSAVVPAATATETRPAVEFPALPWAWIVLLALLALVAAVSLAVRRKNSRTK
ncbi:MAG: hypothetical protein V1857_02975 [archaeon]